MLTGLFVDGWAHRTNKPETFFTPWHGILYSGFAATAVWLLVVIRRGQRPGESVRSAIPVGYGLRVIGVGLFGFGALFDFAWHEIVGIEVDLEALMSPSHLTLLAGGLCMACGPLISTLARHRTNQASTWGDAGGAIASVVFMVSVLQFFLMYVSPYNRGTYPTDSIEAARRIGGEWLQESVTIEGISAILLFTLTTVLGLRALISRLQMPRGAFALLFVLPAFLQTVLTSFDTAYRLAGPIAAAVLAEATWGLVRHRSWTVLGAWVASLQLVQWFAFFGSIGARDGIGWSTHLWAGLPVFAAIVTMLLWMATAPTAGSGSASHP